MSTTMEPITITCQHCDAERKVKPRTDGTPRLPVGWQEHAKRVLCRDCWAAEYVTRTIVIPIAGLDDQDWDALRDALRTCWAASTRLANWAITDLYATDVRRGLVDGKKMPALKPRYQYPAAREIVPDMDSQSVVQLLHWARRQYAAQRYNVIWCGSAALRSERYPVPYPIHNQSWSLAPDKDGAVFVSLRLGGARRRLRLRGGSRYRRQLAALARIVSGEAKAGTITIYRQREQSGDHRPEIAERGNGGRQTVRYRIMLGISVHFPRRAPQECDGTLYVHTGGPESDGGRPLLTYRVGDEAPRYWYARHARRLCCALRRRQYALAHDSKAERRRPRAGMAGIRDAQQALSTRYRRALSAVTHEASAIIARYASRRRVRRVVYDDTDRTFDWQFPWHDLATRMWYKLDDLRIDFEPSGKRESEVPTETA